MGYQRALMPINYLADAAGVKKAVEEYAECYELSGFCTYLGVCDYQPGGALYVCVGGDDCVVDQVAHRFTYRCLSPDNYPERLVLLDESLIERAAKQRPDYVKSAYRHTRQVFETMLEKDRKRRAALEKETEELWPEIVKFLALFGPSTIEAFTAVREFEGHALFDVIGNLERQGLIEMAEGRYKDEVRLTDKALKELSIEPTGPFQTSQDKLYLVLKELGPQTTTHIAAFLNVSTAKANSVLKEQVERGRIVKDVRTKPFMYDLSGEWASEFKAS